MAHTTRIIGSYISPYVRKVLACLELKGVPYEIDPINPFFGGDELSRLSPLRRIPVLIDDAVTLCDSSVICEYLEERYPDPALLPDTAAARAKARWLEEFADTRMGDVLIWRFYYQLVIWRFVWNEETDENIVRKAREEDIPRILDYLESELPADDFIFNCLTIADITISAFFRTASFADYTIDAQRWPKTAGLVARTLAQPVFQKLARYEDAINGAPVSERRTRLQAVGAPLVAKSIGTARPIRGVMPI